MSELSKTQPIDDAEFRASVAQSFSHSELRMARIEQALADNTATTNRNSDAIEAVKERTDEMVDVFQAMKGGFQVLGWIGKLAKWVAPIIAAYAAIRQAGASGDWWPFR